MKPVTIVAILFVLIFSIVVTDTYGNIDGATGKYFCDATRLNIEERNYTEAVKNINDAQEVYKIRNPDVSLDKMNDYLVKQVNANELNTKVKCLAETHGVDPDSVAQFTPEVKEVFSYNIERLYVVAPDLVKYATVPEFGTMTMLILVSSITGIAIISRKFGIKK